MVKKNPNDLNTYEFTETCSMFQNMVFLGKYFVHT